MDEAKSLKRCSNKLAVRAYKEVLLGRAVVPDSLDCCYLVCVGADSTTTLVHGRPQKYDGNWTGASFCNWTGTAVN